MQKDIVYQIIEAANSKIAVPDSQIELTMQEHAFVLNHFQKLQVRKGEFLIEEGQVEEYIYFIECGVFRYLTMNSKRQEVSFHFSSEGEFILPLFSGFEVKKSPYSIQSLCESTVWKIRLSNSKEIYEQSLNLNRLGRTVMEEFFATQLHRVSLLLSMTPMERYYDLIHNQKALLQKIPLKYLASYLGVTPQALSRIRKRAYGE